MTHYQSLSIALFLSVFWHVNTQTSQSPCVLPDGRPCQYQAVMKVFSIYPTFGPESGGTYVSISGRNLLQEPLVVKMGTDIACQIMNRTHNSLVFSTPEVSTIRSFAGQKFDISIFSRHSQIEIKSPVGFTYRPDPVIKAIQPRSSLSRGGIRLTVSGENMMSVAEPKLNFYAITNGNHFKTTVSNCELSTNTTFFCTSPDLSSAEHTDHFVGFTLDGITKYDYKGVNIPREGRQKAACSDYQPFQTPIPGTTSSTTTNQVPRFGCQPGHPGPPTPAGSTGPPAPAGSTGPPAPAGSPGPPAPAGSPGPRRPAASPDINCRPSGPQGRIGESGLESERGPRGERGHKGESGPIGEHGHEGEHGHMGGRGPKGESGPEGERGPIGERGPMGGRGPKGESGPIGAFGPPGETGQPGAPGPAVPPGSTWQPKMTTAMPEESTTLWYPFHCPVCGSFTIFPDPTIDTLSPEELSFRPYSPFNHKYLTIKGKNLERGLSASDYTIFIGDSICEDILLSPTHLMCSPKGKPKKNEKSDSVLIVVQIGVSQSNRIYVGKFLHEDNLWHYRPARIGFISLVVIVPILVIGIVVCVTLSKKSKKDHRRNWIIFAAEKFRKEKSNGNEVHYLHPDTRSNANEVHYLHPDTRSKKKKVPTATLR